MLEIDLVAFNNNIKDPKYKDDLYVYHSPLVYYFLQLFIIIIPIILICILILYQQSYASVESLKLGFDYYLLEGCRNHSTIPHEEQTSFIVIIRKSP